VNSLTLAAFRTNTLLYFTLLYSQKPQGFHPDIVTGQLDASLNLTATLTCRFTNCPFRHNVTWNCLTTSSNASDLQTNTSYRYKYSTISAFSCSNCSRCFTSSRYSSVKIEKNKIPKYGSSKFSVQTETALLSMSDKFLSSE